MAGINPADGAVNETNPSCIGTNPLYIHPAESAGSTLVPSVFDGTGYRSWRRGILRAISVKNKMGFITGNCVKPPPTDPTYNQWERCDDMVISWILNSLSTDIADSLQYVNNAKELWQELKDRYDQPNGAKRYQIQREINDLGQGTLDITSYYTKLKKLWEELNALDYSVLCNCVCACGAKANIHKVEQDRQLIQFLMGLNDIYTVVRGSIQMMNLLPTIAQGFSILIQEEKQREVRPSNQSIIESISLNAGAQNAGRNQFRTNYTQHTNVNDSRGYYNQHQNPSASRNQSYRTNKSQTNRSQLFCDYCRKQGHTKEKCYRLHGFPANFKFTKRRNAGTTAHIHGTRSEPDDNYQNQGQPLTKDQYDQLMRLLDNFQVGNTAEAPQNDAGVAANFAGPFNEEAFGAW
ncbi:hypothetical protein RDI58_002483 [Solanum bulbocastanum]|uniref:Retrotransposon Copia-like N-terminal domain-containing protein n=1 Tax=Solanum bulbocastanum TaxID=147425 RepID=A0AAN8U6V4_SOLBU